MKALIVIDMQNDFVKGNLGTAKAQEIIPNVVTKTKNFDGDVFYTQDTHEENDVEFNKIPKHCVRDTEGWEIIDELEPQYFNIIEKPTFGYLDWEFLEQYDEVELCGVCTDICVVSNALIIRAMFPDKKIVVDHTCCAGSNYKNHFAAINIMKSNLIDVI